MPIVTVTYIGSGNFDRALITGERSFSDFLIHYFLARRDRDLQERGISGIDHFYRTGDLLASLEENPNFEQRYQERRRRILQNPRETVSLWGGGYGTEPMKMEDIKEGMVLEFKKQTPEMLTGDEVRRMMSLSDEELTEMTNKAAKPTLRELILELPGGHGGRVYHVYIDMTRIGYLEEVLQINDGVLELTNGKTVGFIPNFGTSDNPFINDVVVRDVSQESEQVATAKFRHFMEEYIKTSPHGRVALL